MKNNSYQKLKQQNTALINYILNQEINSRKTSKLKCNSCPYKSTQKQLQKNIIEYFAKLN